MANWISTHTLHSRDMHIKKYLYTDACLIEQSIFQLGQLKTFSVSVLFNAVGAKNLKIVFQLVQPKVAKKKSKKQRLKNFEFKRRQVTFAKNRSVNKDASD